MSRTAKILLVATPAICCVLAISAMIVSALSCAREQARPYGALQDRAPGADADRSAPAPHTQPGFVPESHAPVDPLTTPPPWHRPAPKTARADARTAQQRAAAERAEIMARQSQRRELLEQRRREKVRQLFETARQLRKEQRFAEAAEAMRRVLYLDPKNTKARHHLEVYEDFAKLRKQIAPRAADPRKPPARPAGDQDSLTPWSYETLYPRHWAQLKSGQRMRPPRRVILRPDEELWIIQKPTAMSDAADEHTPGCGQLCAKLPTEEKEVLLPLKHTDVAASIAGYVATVDVTQQYHNPYDTKIEAVYVFPLPQNAAVNEFVMTIAERRIRGIIREREEAEEIYREARRQGYVASLLTQERPNIFTQSVANIEPGKQININIKYFHTLAYADGWYEFVFPMVVGPRFNPPGFGGPVKAVGHGSPAANRARSASAGTTVEYLKPNERSGHDIGLTVNIDAGVEIEDVQSHNHVVAVHQPSPSQAEVELSPNDSIPNKDFVLRYRVAGERIKSAFVTHRDERGGYFTLMVYPPDNLAALARKPMEMIFVLDCSGSMSGQPIAQAKTAVERALRHMQPDDTFQIIRFSNDASQLGPEPIEATPGNIRRGLRYVKSLNGGGGTMMIEGIKAALDFPHDPRRLRVVAFLTDGYIGNEREILGEAYKRLGDARIFSFGVGSSPNRYLLERMAKLGRGVVAYVSLNDSAADVVDLFFERISHPVMTDLAIDWGGLRVSEVFPQRLPDLFVGRPVILTGRYDGEPATPIRITGTVADGRHEIMVPATGESAGASHDGLPFVWARMKIADLYDSATHDDNNELPLLVKATALEYGLMSAYTAFVAVDSLARTAGDYGTTVAVPVPVPEGVRYETTVSD